MEISKDLSSPKLHEPTFVEGTFQTDWENIGRLGWLTAKKVTETFQVFLTVAPSCPGTIKAEWPTQTRPFSEGPFELRNEVHEKKGRDFVIKIPEGWILVPGTKPEVAVMREAGSCSHAVTVKDNEITAHATCGGLGTVGYLQFNIKYEAQQIYEPIDLRRGETRELSSDLKNVTFEGQGMSYSRLEFTGSGVSLERSEDGKYLLKAML